MTLRSRIYRLTLFGAILLLLTVLAAPAAAAGGDWVVWLYDSDVGRANRVEYIGGTASSTFDGVLPVPDKATYSQNISISRDGRYLAYAYSAGTTTALRIYDVATSSVIADLPLPEGAQTSLDFAGHLWMWDSTSTRFAFGYSALGMDFPPPWTLSIYDVTDNSLTSLTSADPAVSGVVPADGFIIPAVQRFDDFTVSFAAVYGATEGRPAYDAFAWDFTGGTVTPSAVYTSLDFDQTGLGEAVFMTRDEAFPGAFAPEAGFPIPNMVSYYDAFTGTTGVLQNAEYGFNPTFVQASEAYAVRFYDPSSGGVTALRVYSRGGTLLGELPSASVLSLNSLIGTIGGFVYTGLGGGPGGTTLYQVYTRPGSDPAPFTPVSVWNSTLGANYKIVWGSDSTLPPVFPPEPWGVPASAGGLGSGIVIDPNVIVPLLTLDPNLLQVPTLISPQIVLTVPPIQPAITIPALPTLIAPPVIGGLRVGGQALIQTTAGDPLNVRSGPGRSSPVLGLGRSGETVTLLQGPVSADGFSWWQLQLPSGLVGWAVEAADGIQTLVPIG